jgi:hypothetical protein
MKVLCEVNPQVRLLSKNWGVLPSFSFRRAV